MVVSPGISTVQRALRGWSLPGALCGPGPLAGSWEHCPAGGVLLPHRVKSLLKGPGALRWTRWSPRCRRGSATAQCAPAKDVTASDRGRGAKTPLRPQLPVNGTG